MSKQSRQEPHLKRFDGPFGATMNADEWAIGVPRQRDNAVYSKRRLMLLILLLRRSYIYFVFFFFFFFFRARASCIGFHLTAFTSQAGA